MQRILRQLAIFVTAFFLLWFALSQINFLGNDKIQKLSNKNESSLGDMFLEQVFNSYNEIKNDSALTVIKKIKDRIKSYNNLDTAAISLYIIRNEEINAYAFPGRNIVVHSGLIEFVKSPEELAAVLAHEMAHIEKDHVMKKLTKEVGIALLAAVVGNNGNSEMIADMVQMVTSNYYSRDLESEADATAVQYLANAGINPENLANFLYRLSSEYKDVPKELEWVSTHPIAKERAAEILELSGDLTFSEQTIIDSSTWIYIREKISSNN